jgi:hypothetical protein
MKRENDNVWMIKQQSVVAHSKLLFQHFPEGTEEYFSQDDSQNRVRKRYNFN